MEIQRALNELYSPLRSPYGRSRRADTPLCAAGHFAGVWRGVEDYRPWSIL